MKIIAPEAHLNDSTKESGWVALSGACGARETDQMRTDTERVLRVKCRPIDWPVTNKCLALSCQVMQHQFPTL